MTLPPCTLGRANNVRTLWSVRCLVLIAKVKVSRACEALHIYDRRQSLLSWSLRFVPEAERLHADHRSVPSHLLRELEFGR